MRPLLVFVLPALFLVAPPATAQADEDVGYGGAPVEIVLYGHIYDLLNKVPINTQPPIDLDLAKGFLLPTLSKSAPGIGNEQNKLYLWATPGFVEYNISTKSPRLHPEIGISTDVELDKGKSVMGYWYMSADALESTVTGEPPVHVGALPHLTVRATMRTGSGPGSDLEAGQVIAVGETTMDVVNLPGQAEVYEFVVDLGKPLMDIPRDDAFNVKFEWFQLENGEEKSVDRQWNLHTGAKFPNRVVLQVANPIHLLFVHPQFVGANKVAIHTQFNSPFGNYDVDPASLKLTIEGPTRPSRVSEPIIVQHTYIHNHHQDPVDVSWVWDFRAENALPGEYKVTVTGANLQKNAVATKSAIFTIKEGGRVGDAIGSGGNIILPASVGGEEVAEEDPATPAAPFGFLLIAAFVGALVARRRK
ncbi:MAG: hypothetical protein ACT4PT_14000 [Methanobacteriota archaeon]